MVAIAAVAIWAGVILIIATFHVDWLANLSTAMGLAI